MPESRPSDLLHETDEIVTMTVASIKTLCAKQRRSRNRKFTMRQDRGRSRRRMEGAKKGYPMDKTRI